MTTGIDQMAAGAAMRWVRGLTGGSLIWVAAAVAVVMAMGVLRPVEDAFAALRYDVLHRPPSQGVAVVEIDTPSLRAAGRWPWPRDRFAVAIARLEAAGAKSVAFDVDFSVQSSGAADRSLAEAIAAHPGTVLLPTFVQTVDEKRGASRLVETFPLAGLANDALVASVNIPIDPDGRVRRYAFGFGRDEAYRQSMGAALAQLGGQRTGTFLLDYSVDPAAVPHLSFEDVLTGRFDPAAVRGRDVLIGARALELGDAFSTPQYGIVNGVYIHALAFEALSAGRALITPQPLLTFLLAVGLAVFLRADRKGASLRSVFQRQAAAAAVLLIAPVVIQALTPISLQIAPLVLAQGLCIIWATRAELDRRAKAIVAEREAGLLHLAMHDAETGLANRRALLAELSPLVSDARTMTAAVAVGIDRYVAIRGAMGYTLFSQIMREVAARAALTCPGSTVSLLSTSILGLALHAADRAALDRVIAKLQTIDPGYVVDGHPVEVQVRLGVAYAGSDGTDAEALLEHATLALDQARGEDRFLAVFDPASLAETRINLALMSDMRRGLEGGQFELHYQPKLTVADGLVHGVEGLIRWTHPVHGRMRPDAFIMTAEETGAIRDLTFWTLRRALDDADRLRADGHSLLISVNISGRLIVDASFCETTLAMTRGRENDLCLEITETAFIASAEAARATIAAFRGAGLKISIDDYGAGLSSLSYLKLIEANELKIDRSLILAVTESRRDRQILRSTIDLAHSLGMVVVGEGVETAEGQAVLAGLGCDMIQGYVVARPMPLADLRSFLATWKAEAVDDRSVRTAASR